MWASSSNFKLTFRLKSHWALLHTSSPEKLVEHDILQDLTKTFTTEDSWDIFHLKWRSSFEVMHFLSSTRLFVSREKSPSWNNYLTFEKLSHIHLFNFLFNCLQKLTFDLKNDEKSSVCDCVNKLWAISCDSMRSKRVRDHLSTVF